MAKADEAVIIVGPAGDRIEITRGDFKSSHYAEQGYTEDGPAPDPAAEPDVPATHENI